MKKLRKLKKKGEHEKPKKKRDYPAETERDRATGRRPARQAGRDHRQGGSGI